MMRSTTEKNLPKMKDSGPIDFWAHLVNRNIAMRNHQRWNLILMRVIVSSMRMNLRLKMNKAEFSGRKW